MQWGDRIGRRLRLKDLHTLQTVAEVGSMAKASKHLALSQPAISKAISDMERMLGAPLMDRSSRGIELTESGRLLVERCRVIFDEVKQGIREIEHLSDPTRGHVRIGAIGPVTAAVSEIICQLARRYPRITYEVTVGDPDTLERELRARTLDVLLTRWNSRLGADDLAAEVLYKSTLAVMADKSHPMVTRKRLALADLMQEQWTLSPPDSYLGRIGVDLFRRRKLPLPPTVVTTTSTHMRLNLLSSGRFLSLLPTTLLRHQSNRAWLRALNIDLSDGTGPVALITVKNRRSAGAVKLFLEFSRTVCREFGR